LAGVILTVLLAPAPTVSNANPSSYSTGKLGTWALYHLVERLGGRPQRLTGSGFRADLRPDLTLVEAGPSTPFDPAQLRSLRVFLERGGTLVLALQDRLVDAPLLRLLHLTMGARVRSGSWPELLPLGGAGPLVVESAATNALNATSPSAVPLLGPANSPLAQVESVGRGEAVVLSSDSVLSNSLLERSGNARFATAALRVSPGREVAFDEIHHGYSVGDGVQALLLESPLGLVGVLLALLLLAFLATSGRRLGRPLPPPELISVRTTDDHLDAVARLYSRARDQRAIASSYLTELLALSRARPLDGTRAGVPPNADPRIEAVAAKLEQASREQIGLQELRRLVARADLLEREFVGGFSEASQEAGGA
jgi:hypothetical protein